MSSEPVRLCARDGRVLDLPVGRWFAAAAEAEHGALDRAVGPALDIGCGPGRHLVALSQREVFALGIDISPAFLEVARARGVNVLERSVFDQIPGSGRWQTALLLDGNIGIGGNPVALLSRVLALLAPDGRIIVEIEPHDTPHGSPHDVLMVRAETPTMTGPWFRWTTVDPRRLESVARSLDLDVTEAWTADRRSFARLDRTDTVSEASP